MCHHNICQIICHFLFYLKSIISVFDHYKIICGSEERH
jgi:hypothetical protein